MNHWRHIVGEGICLLGEGQACTRGLDAPSPFCLVVNDDWAICNHLGWADATEREAALYVPLRFVVWDRLCHWVEEARIGLGL